jgi:hypothetical protein
MDSRSKKIAGLIRRLLNSRFVLQLKNRSLFQGLIDEKVELGRFFEKMGAELIIQENLGLAYVRSSETYDEESAEFQLGRRITLSELPSLLLIFLRQKRLQFFLSPIDHEVPRISRTEIREFTRDFGSEKEKEDRKFELEFNRALDRLIELQVLLPNAEKTHFEISGVCDILLPADQIQDFKSRAEIYFKEGNSPSSSSELQVEVKTSVIEMKG